MSATFAVVPLAADLSGLKVPNLNYAAMAPLLILLGAACVGVLVEAFAPRRSRSGIQFVLSFAALLAALAAVIQLARAGTNKDVLTADVALAVDGPALFLQGTLLVLGLVALLLMAERSLERGGAFVAQAAIPVGGEADRRQVNASGATEVFPLTLFALAGMMLFVTANDLLTMFVALEVFSLPLYLLCAMARRRRLVSQEAALKYFLLGAYASAFYVFGMALLYGFSGSVLFGAISDATASGDRNRMLLFVGLAMVSVGLLFKIAAVPFHVWTPDVYQGAPTSVTAFMAACTKVAAFGGLLRVLYAAFDRTEWDITPVLGMIAILTMLVGAILAVTQTDIKRLLAYSSIANAGYLLVGVLAFGKEGLANSMFYLVAYGFAVLAAFGVVTLVRDEDGEATHLSRWAGLGKRSPLVAGVFTFLLLAFAGIPLTSGFVSKFGVFSAALGVQGGWQIAMVVAGVVTSMIIAFPYLRVVVMMWLSDPAEQSPTVAIPGAFTSAALMVGVAATLLLGVFPAPLLDLAAKASEFIR
jgi:NADH-quinone oxidoreductase subunit N